MNLFDKIMEVINKQFLQILISHLIYFFLNTIGQKFHFSTRSLFEILIKNEDIVLCKFASCVMLYSLSCYI